MRIGYDARQAFHNGTGLGHYSRTLISTLSLDFPSHQYFLFNTKPSPVFSLKGNNIHEVLPGNWWHRLAANQWATGRVTQDIRKLKLDIYHGLDHMLPAGLKQAGSRSVVSIHDLIPERFPQHYKASELKRFRKNVRFACTQADRIITISEQTRKDLVEMYGFPADKMVTCYQSCHPRYLTAIDENEKQQIRQKYKLPEKFFLYVSSIIERKNLLGICKAMFLLRHDLQVPLVVIGNGGQYKQQVKDYIRQAGIEQKIIFLTESREARESASFQTADDLPAIYRSALAMIYPSFFEGFGIPVLEALWCRLPVITSYNSSIPEVAGEAVHYVNPLSAEEIAGGMKRILHEPGYAEELKVKGDRQAQAFTPAKAARDVMHVYEGLFSQGR